MEGRQQSWPRAWLMTDERLGGRLWGAIGRLPRGAGIVFRHYSLEPRERQILADRIADAARGRGLILAIARDAELARRTGAALVHNPRRDAGGLPFSRAAHSLEEAEFARREGAALVFVSPVYSTRSHPGRKPLGPERAINIAKAAGVRAIALGGMDEQKFAVLEREGFYGWAGIDAWLGVRT
jgi:thiamine-phosphate pyrophosphorylase